MYCTVFNLLLKRLTKNVQHSHVCSVFVFKNSTRAAVEENKFTVQVVRPTGHVVRIVSVCISVD